MAELEDEIFESVDLTEIEFEFHQSRTVVPVAETVRLLNTTAWANLHKVSVSDTANFSQTVMALVGAVVIERLGLAETYLTRTTYGVIYAESLGLSDAISLARQVEIVESLNVPDTVYVARGVQVIEELNLMPVFRGAAKYGMGWVDSVLLADRLARFANADVVETLQLIPVWGGRQRAQRTLSDSIELTEAYTPRFLLSAVASDGVEFTAEQLINMIYQPELHENILISAAYLSPGGGFTAWSMNTRTAATTEYDNYEFNSFVLLGNKYIAASDEGLFELNGDDDDGDDIIAQIKSGFMQFGGTKLSRLKAAYLGVRGDGDFVLRIITGDDVTYDYAASTRDMRSTKVHMGKGQRARYFAFELISAGQDFDLDTIEFVPIVVQRRV